MREAHNSKLKIQKSKLRQLAQQFKTQNSKLKIARSAHFLS